MRNLSDKDLQPVLQLAPGDWYDGDAIGRTSDLMEEAIHNRGYAFVDVRPRVTRNPEQHTVDLTFDVGEGPRVYVERIDIVGNTRTEDKVIRREFRLAEGDPYSAEAVRRSKTRLTDLGYFQNVDIATNPGSASDKAILNTTIAEKATGELSFGGGYSTDAGALVDIGLSERNLVGTGINASINGVLAQRRSSINTSVTDPYFLDRNLIAGIDVFLIQTNFLGTEPYDEKRAGFALRLGYAFNEHLRQVWSYSLVDRDVFNVETGASPFILNEAGTTLLSQISQVLTLDYRDSKVVPAFRLYRGIRHRLRRPRRRRPLPPRQPQRRLLHPAGAPARQSRLGHQDRRQRRLHGPAARRPRGNHRPLLPRRRQSARLPDRRRRPSRHHHRRSAGWPLHLDADHRTAFPLPVSPDLGLNGRAFVDVGALTEASFSSASACQVSAGQSC